MISKTKLIYLFPVLFTLLFSCINSTDVDTITYKLTSEEREMFPDSTKGFFKMIDEHGNIDEFICQVKDTFVSTVFISTLKGYKPVSMDEQLTVTCFSNVFNNMFSFSLTHKEKDTEFDLYTYNSIYFTYGLRKKQFINSAVRINPIHSELYYSDKELINGKEYNGNYIINFDKQNTNLKDEDIIMYIYSKHYGITKFITKANETWSRIP